MNRFTWVPLIKDDVEAAYILVIALIGSIMILSGVIYLLRRFMNHEARQQRREARKLRQAIDEEIIWYIGRFGHLSPSRRDVIQIVSQKLYLDATEGRKLVATRLKALRNKVWIGEKEAVLFLTQEGAPEYDELLYRAERSGR